MKVSYNRGADLMTCLSAAKTGSTNCNDGLTQEVKTFSDLGVLKTSIYPFDGAGSNDQNRVTPTALATFYKAATQTPYAKALHDSLPILGKDGTLATSVPNSPAAGKAEIKTGNRAVGTPAGQLILLGNTLAGYIQAKSGRELTCFIGVANVPMATTADFLAVTADQAQMVVAIQQAF
jgi:D-alanyl-D-alanine carboxypeptidase/D-alanyl-D-alanine-endopeptidase (penicillin-binding protein 4)